MIIARFTFLAEDFVAFIMSPNSVARGTASPVGLLQIALCHLGSQAYFEISVFWEVSINIVFLEF